LESESPLKYCAFADKQEQMNITKTAGTNFFIDCRHKGDGCRLFKIKVIISLKIN
jgi:hypothetical protein